MSTIPILPSFRWLAAAGLAFVALISASCNSDGSALAGPSAAGTSHTATIVGRVNGATASAASVQASSSKGGIRVSVVGTSISATTDASGQFTLPGVPTGSGSVALRFEGRGIDATLQISGLTPGQTLEISVQLAGNNVTLDDDDDDDQGEDETQFTGTIDSVGTSSLVVSGRTVLVDSSTEIKDGGNTTTLAALVVGTQVEVEGTLQPDGSVLARKIRVENNGGGGDDGEDEDGDGGDDDEDVV